MKKDGENDSDSIINEIESGEGSQKTLAKVIIIIVFVIIIGAGVFIFLILPKISIDSQGENESSVDEGLQGQSNVNDGLCIEDWRCTNWSDCIDELKKRDCSDFNKCNTTLNKPEITMDCLEVLNNNSGNLNASNNLTCEEEFLMNMTHQCVGIEVVQRKWVNVDCSIEWKDFTYCPVDRKCFVNESSLQTLCVYFSCGELGGAICDQNKTCESNSFQTARDSDECCITTCLNATV